MGDWKGTKVPARFVVYEDRYGNSIITLPRDLEAVRAGAYQAPDPNATTSGTFWCGRPIPIRNAWYEFSASGPGNELGTDGCRGIIPLNGRYTTFVDWDEAMRLRIDPEVDESPGGTIIFRGRLNGSKVYTSTVGGLIEGIPLAFVTAGAVTTTASLDEPPYQIIKPKTKGRLRLYAVDSDDVATLVGDYEPDETGPSYIRYKVPACPTDT